MKMAIFGNASNQLALRAAKSLNNKLTQIPRLLKRKKQ